MHAASLMGLSVISVIAGTASAQGEHAEHDAPSTPDEEPPVDEEPMYGATAVIEPPSSSSEEVSLEEARELPGALGDPLRAIESLPGVYPIRSGMPYVFVRGAPPASTAYYYDGIQLPTIAHMGVGPAVIHPIMWGDVELHSGVAPVRYGRHTGGAVVARGSPPMGRLGGEIDLRVLDVTGAIEVPTSRGNVRAAGRYGYPGLILQLTSKGTTLAYWDYQLRSRQRIGSGLLVEVVSIGAFDRLRNPPWADAGDGTSNDMEVHFHRLELRMTRVRTDFEVGMALGFGYEASVLGDALSVTAWRVGPRLRGKWTPSERFGVRLGADFVGSTGSLDDPSGRFDGPAGSIKVDLPLYADAAARGTAGGYAELLFRPVDRLALTGGVRSDVWIVDGDPQSSLDPRLRATVTASEGVRIHAAVGTAHQPAVWTFPVPGLTDVAIDQGLQRAVQSEVGLSLRLPKELELRTQGYIHRMTNLLIPDVTWGWERGDCDGGRPGGCVGELVPPRVATWAYGGELFFKTPAERPYRGILSYTLAKATARSEDGQAFVPRFDVRHTLNAVGGYTWKRRLHFGLRVLARSGGVAEEYRLPWFYRVDVELGYKWSTSWGSMKAYLEWLNLTWVKEPIDVDCRFPLSDPDCTVEYLGPIVMPSLGVRATL